MPRLSLPEAVATAGYDSVEAAAKDGTAFVFMGHGTSHRKVSYSQMQTAMQTLAMTMSSSARFRASLSPPPADVIEAVKAAGYTKVVLRPLMVVAGDHANNDMAGADEDSWLSQFEASGDIPTLSIARSQAWAGLLTSSSSTLPTPRLPSTP